jgi:hypothetical protein
MTVYFPINEFYIQKYTKDIFGCECNLFVKVITKYFNNQAVNYLLYQCDEKN